MKETRTDNLRNEHSFAKFNEHEINLHIAEYNALTNRGTYFINIQNILLTALIAWAILIITIWDSKFENIISWGFLIGAQLITILNANFTHEHYTIVKYIESDLKPKIIKLINKESFWNYEQFLIKERNKNHASKAMLIFEFLAVIISGTVVVANFIYRLCNWNNWDSLGFFLNLMLLLVLFIQTLRCVKLRLRNWQ